MFIELEKALKFIAYCVVLGISNGMKMNFLRQRTKSVVTTDSSVRATGKTYPEIKQSGNFFFK
jgi:hypothetical protein